MKLSKGSKPEDKGETRNRELGSNGFEPRGSRLFGSYRFPNSGGSDQIGGDIIPQDGIRDVGVDSDGIIKICSKQNEISMVTMRELPTV